MQFKPGSPRRAASALSFVSTRVTVAPTAERERRLLPPSVLPAQRAFSACDVRDGQLATFSFSR
jgi:hypothetical protein